MNWLRSKAKTSRSKRSEGISEVRWQSNQWLRQETARATGSVLSIGSMDDSDGEGGRYRDYFTGADRYVTSDVEGDGLDLILDVQDMPSIEDGAYDTVFCSGVLEHVPDPFGAIREINRVLAPGGLLLLGLPFMQGIHLAPRDYWRFTRFGIEQLLTGLFEIEQLVDIQGASDEWPQSYWVRALKP